MTATVGKVDRAEKQLWSRDRAAWRGLPPLQPGRRRSLAGGRGTLRA